MKTSITFLVIFLLLGIPASISAQNSEKILQQGMMKEEGEGDLDAAIEIYENLANDPNADRAYRAKALLQLGICYEKLGQKKASSTYQKLITEFGDQKDLIAVAKRKLKNLQHENRVPESEGVVIQELKKGIENIIFSVSPNGRYMVWMGYSNGAPELVSYDFLTGKETFITSENTNNYDSPEKYLPWSAVWTHDSKKMVYCIAYSNADRKDIRISDANGSNTEILMTSRQNKMINYNEKGPDDDDRTIGRIGDIFDFSPDDQKLLFTRKRMVNNTWNHELVEMTLSNKKLNVLKTIDVKPGSSVEYHFRYSPDGQFIAYTNFSDVSNSSDIFVYDIRNKMESPFTTESFNETSPFWSPKGDKILYAFDNFISTDLMAKSIEKGRPVGKELLIMKDLGQGVDLKGIDNQGAIYYRTNTSRKEIFTVDLDKNLDLDANSVNKISLPSLKYGGDFARYSKDGRYISYHTWYSETFRGYGNVGPDLEYDPALGNKYAIFIYDSKTGKSKFLDIDLYQNHWPRANSWMVPEWSYHGNKLIVNGRSRENYAGGFFEIDVDTEDVTPILTLPGSKHTDMKLVGQYMRYSKKPDIIYYSSLGWKNAMQYNRKTKEKNAIATIEDGFWFEGFSDEAETKVRAMNRFGVYEYDINTHEIKTLKEGGYPHHIFPIPSANGKNSFIDLRWDEENQRRGIQVLDEEGNPLKELDLKLLFENDNIEVFEKHPKKDQFLIRVVSNPGKSVYKLGKVFELN